MEFFSFIKDKHKNIFNIGLFVLTILIIVYLLPREGKFKYEFQKGKPWMHETLIAPFDFPVYKKQQQVETEEDSILENLKPYFKYDSTVHKMQKDIFERTYESNVESFLTKDTSSNELRFSRQSRVRFKKVTETFYSEMAELLDDVYQKGIIQSSEVNVNLDSDSRIVILEDNVAREYPYSEVYNQKEAYKYLVNQSEKIVKNLKKQYNLNDERKLDFFEDIEFYDYIKPNLNYDKETTEQVRQSLLSNLSITEGMVQAGERIISKGEVVDAKTYQILESLKREYEGRLGGEYQSNLVLLGQFIFVFAAIFVLYLFLFHFRIEILQNISKTIFILLLVILMILISTVTISLQPEVVYILPFAILPIMIKSFYDARLALFIHIITVMIVGFFAPNSFEFVFMNFTVGIVAIFSLTSLNRRGKLFLSSILVIVSYSFIFFGLSITQEGNIKNIEWMNFAYFGMNGAMVLASYPLIYVFEKSFGFLSDVTLMELSDTNQPLLRRLSEESPGTFQHSLQVANLAETAVYQIGGNSLLVRTGALYHDIGKMENPIYFVENQDRGFNPHEHLEFEESAKIIIGHVKKGVQIADKYKLPAGIVDFIRTHHGTTKVQYFYKRFLKENGQEVDDSKFTYSGPKPFSKEMAVLMMSDAVEAASRSYAALDEKTINSLVDNIIDSQLNEGQFENVDITLREITIIKGLFKKKLQNFYHARIKYPK
ncbi:MAG: HD family phosphohydrolase [Bacteroidota bacterium]